MSTTLAWPSLVNRRPFSGEKLNVLPGVKAAGDGRMRYPRRFCLLAAAACSISLSGVCGRDGHGNRNQRNQCLERQRRGGRSPGSGLECLVNSRHGIGGQHGCEQRCICQRREWRKRRQRRDPWERRRRSKRCVRDSNGVQYGRECGCHHERFDGKRRNGRQRRCWGIGFARRGSGSGRGRRQHERQRNRREQ